MPRNRHSEPSSYDYDAPPPPYPGQPRRPPPYHGQPPPPYPGRQQHVVIHMLPQPQPFQPMVLYLIPEDVRARHCFILKVYLILFAQLAVVTGMTAALLMIEPAQKWMAENEWMYIVVICLWLVFLIILLCFRTIRRKWPYNLIFLLIFTALTGYMTAVLASKFSGWTVLIAAGITTGTVVIVSLFSLQTWVDLTKLGGIMMVITFSLLIVGIFLGCFHAFLPHYPILNVVYSGIVAVVFVVWLAIDTQMLLGNKEYALTVDEYIFAALQLFLDIIYIFWHLLIVIGGVRGQ